jgi:hypothetical protein
MEDLSCVLAGILILFLILASALYYYTYMYESNVMIINSSSVNDLDPEIVRRIAEFLPGQAGVQYNYFDSFFEMGKKFKYLVYWEDEQIYATACAVLVELDQPAWFICDVKVAPSHRGKRIPYRMFCKASMTAYLECDKMFTYIPTFAHPKAAISAIYCGFEPAASFLESTTTETHTICRFGELDFNNGTIYQYNLPDYDWKEVHLPPALARHLY